MKVLQFYFDILIEKSVAQAADTRKYLRLLEKNPIENVHRSVKYIWFQSEHSQAHSWKK